jgi:histidyl-tRNA synthetase
MKAQMKAANRSGAPLAVIVGEQEVAEATATVRDLSRGEQAVVPRDQLTAHIRKVLEEK